MVPQLRSCWLVSPLLATLSTWFPLIVGAPARGPGPAGHFIRQTGFLAYYEVYFLICVNAYIRQESSCMLV